jgi:hypothetical protein
MTRGSNGWRESVAAGHECRPFKSCGRAATRPGAQLIEQVEVAEIRRQKRAAHLAGLEEQERVVEKLNASGPPSKAHHQTGQHPRLAKGPRRRGRQPVRRDVVDHAADR